VSDPETTALIDAAWHDVDRFSNRLVTEARRLSDELLSLAFAIEAGQDAGWLDVPTSAVAVKAFSAIQSTVGTAGTGGHLARRAAEVETCAAIISALAPIAVGP
jgi:hypothetical protein